MKIHPLPCAVAVASVVVAVVLSTRQSETDPPARVRGTAPAPVSGNGLTLQPRPTTLPSRPATAVRVSWRELNAESFGLLVQSLTADEAESILREPAAFFSENLSPTWRQAVLARWADLDPAAALRYSSRSSPADLGFVFHRWSRGDGAAACAWLRQSGDRYLAAQLLGGPMSSELPVAAALTLFEALPEDAKSQQLGFELLARATPKDIDAWLQDSTTTPLRLRTLVQYCQLHPEQARANILEAALDIRNRAERDQVTSVILAEWARTDPLGAVEWLDRLPAGTPAKTTAWGGVVAQWAEKDPLLAAEIAAGVEAGPAQRAAVVSAVSGWAHQDPLSAAAWVGRFPDGRLRREATQQLIFAWARHDPSAAERWAAALPYGRARDEALVTIRRMSSRQAREAAN